MKLVPIAAAVAVACLPLYAHAAPTAEFEDSVRQQLQQLTERLNKVEQENSKLASANQALAAENAELKAQESAQPAQVITSQDVAATQAAVVAPVSGEFRKISDSKDTKSADASKGIAFKGDFRYRYDDIHDDSRNASGRIANEDRQRIRARFGFAAKATDNINVAVQLATTQRNGAEDNGDPRSANQTLGDEFSRKRVNLDLAYFDWNFAEGFNLEGGKMPYPFKRPGQSFFYDADVNPEGLSVGYKRGMFFGTGYVFSLKEVGGAKTADNADSFMSGLQAGAIIPVRDSNFLAAVHYTDYSGVQNRAPFYGVTSAGANGPSNGNTTKPSVIAGIASPVLANDFNIVELLGEFNTKLFNLPFQVWLDAAQNTKAKDNKNDTAFAGGVVLGKAVDSRTWEVGVLYQRAEADSLFGQLYDSDFGGGTTDSKGVVVRAGYAIIKNWVLNATYFANKRNFDLGKDTDYNRLEVDLNLKF